MKNRNFLRCPRVGLFSLMSNAAQPCDVLVVLACLVALCILCRISLLFVWGYVVAFAVASFARMLLLLDVALGWKLPPSELASKLLLIHCICLLLSSGLQSSG